MKEGYVSEYGEKRFPELWIEWINGMKQYYNDQGGMLPLLLLVNCVYVRIGVVC